MKNYTVWLVLGLFLLPPVIMGLSTESDLIKDLQKKLNSFYQRSRQTKIQLTLNQPKYVAGDTAYFKALLLSAEDLKLVEGKQIINLKLLSEDHKIFLFNRFVSKDGIGIGQLILPEDIPYGNYWLVAYSDEMEKNLDPSLFYQSLLTIAGPKEFIQDEYPSLDVFSEGGNLVSGVINTIVVKTTLKEKEGSLLDSSGKNIVKFNISNAGLGDFNFTPEWGEKYFVETEGLRKALPEVKKDGVVLHVSKNENNESISTTVQAASSSRWRTGKVYLVLTIQNKICFSTTLSLEQDSIVTVSIPLKNCRPGVAQLTVFSPNADVLSERLISIDPTNPVNITLALDEENYITRKPVALTISAKDLYGNALRSSLSVSVYHQDLFSSHPLVQNLSDNLLLHSDLGSWPVATSVKKSKKDGDNFLITQNWRRFQWNDLFTGLTPTTQDNTIPFYFKGKVSFTKKEKIVPDSTCITFYLNGEYFAYEVFTQRNGEFEFPLFMDFSDDEVFYSVRYKKQLLEDAQVFLDESQIALLKPTRFKLGSTDSYASLSKLKNPLLQSFSYYAAKHKKDDVVTEFSENKNSMLESDFSVSLKKYAPFGSIGEILNEVIPMVRYTKVKDKNVIRVFLNESSTFARQNPLYIIDGIMTDSTAYFLGLDPSQISSISVLQSPERLLMFGALGKNGIILVDTKVTGLYNAIPKSKRSFHVTGLTLPLRFISKINGHEDSRIPNLQSTLYWNAEVKTDDVGKAAVRFFTGDGTGPYVVHVEGITEDGVPFMKETNFNVSFEAH